MSVPFVLFEKVSSNSAFVLLFLQNSCCGTFLMLFKKYILNMWVGICSKNLPWMYFLWTRFIFSRCSFKVDLTENAIDIFDHREWLIFHFSIKLPFFRLKAYFFILILSMLLPFLFQCLPGCKREAYDISLLQSPAVRIFENYSFNLEFSYSFLQV